MIYTEMTKKAIRLMFDLHKEQTDKSGLPYVFHPWHVAESMDDEITATVALLHDAVEDTALTLADIEAAFGPETAAAVDAISRREGEAWEDYIARVKANPMATKVRIRISEISMYFENRSLIFLYVGTILVISDYVSFCLWI